MKLRSRKKRVNTPQSRETNGSLKFIICIFLVISTLAVYWQVKDHEFINYDDDVYITSNLNVQTGLTRESVYWAFTTSHFSNWHPVTWLSHMLDYEVYGERPKGHHLTSLFFHIATALILFIVLSRMTGELWRSGFVAAMFAFHPLNIESVAWVAERKNVLSTLFWLITMWAYIHYTEKPSIKSYSLVSLFFVLGLMTKPMLVTLPFVLLLLDYWPLRRFKFLQVRDSSAILEKNIAKESEFLRLVLEKIPLFLLAVASSIVTFIVQKTGGALNAMETISLSARLNNAMSSYVKYLGKMMWPEKLAVLYPHPENTISAWEGILCGTALLGITIISIRLVRKAPYFVVGWFWYLGTFVPVIQIVQTGVHQMADRYAYVPLIGIFIVIAWGVPELISKWRCKEKVLSISAGVVIFVLMVVAWVQVGHWKNSITLFKHAISVTENQYPSFAIAYDNLGIALAKKGDVGEAITHYKTAIKINPNYANTYNNLGVVLARQENLEEAITHYKTAIKIAPNFAKAYNNLGHALGKKGDIGAAITHYKTAIKINPNFSIAYDNLGIALGQKGDIDAAITHYKTAIKINPNSAETYNNLGTGLAQQGSLKEAINYFQEALRLKPDLISARRNLEMAIRLYGEAGESK